MTGTQARGALILVVDADSKERASLRSTLEQAGYTTAEAATGTEALDAVRKEPPGLVMLEIRLDDICGYEVCRQLREEFGEALPIVFVSGERTEAFDRVAGILIGADDYLVKPYAACELVARVRRLVRRTAPVVPGVAAKLTAREMEILHLLADGLEQDEIAARLYITRKTVGTHIEHILHKLGVRSRAQAVALAYRDDLVGTRP